MKPLLKAEPWMGSPVGALKAEALEAAKNGAR